ncbi:hypothetical protein BKA70DRAFT_1234453 [Coprinopsis sp. MPI-PUGE-AT-0042]|nr:hypothetical protein BKA70DRAFT_1234453 [Coprinopsis sp. MPI-PUGE-AT-0042]
MTYCVAAADVEIVVIPEAHRIKGELLKYQRERATPIPKYNRLLVPHELLVPMPMMSHTRSLSNSELTGVLENEAELQRNYRSQLDSVQHAMGLRSDNQTFWRVKTAVFTVARKLNLRPSSALGGKETSFSSKLDRAAWWVRDRVPVGSNYQSLRGPISSLLEIRCAEIDKREALFRAINGSTATLPDYDRLLELEDLAGEQGTLELSLQLGMS